MEKRIYPYLIKSKSMAGYYELLFDEGFELKIFDKKKDKEMYNFFLPTVNNYMFWTFNLTDVKGFNQMKNDLKAPVCSDYDCNIFVKGDSEVICFRTGVCLALTDDPHVLEKVKTYEARQDMEEINIRDTDSYPILDNDVDKYMYIIQLHKMIYLNKLLNCMKKESLLDKARNSFVEFTTKFYDVKITDDKEAENKLKRWADDFEIEDKYLKADNQFDLIYKNSRINDYKSKQNLLIGASVVLLIVSVVLLALHLN
jgi:hypothetical protein